MAKLAVALFFYADASLRCYYEVLAFLLCCYEVLAFYLCYFEGVAFIKKDRVTKVQIAAVVTKCRGEVGRAGVAAAAVLPCAQNLCHRNGMKG